MPIHLAVIFPWIVTAAVGCIRMGSLSKGGHNTAGTSCSSFCHPSTKLHGAYYEAEMFSISQAIITPSASCYCLRIMGHLSWRCQQCCQTMKMLRVMLLPLNMLEAGSANGWGGSKPASSSFSGIWRWGVVESTEEKVWRRCKWDGESAWTLLVLVAGARAGGEGSSLVNSFLYPAARLAQGCCSQYIIYQSFE